MTVDLEIVDRIIELTKQYRDLPAHDELRKPLREAIESLIYPQIIYTGPPAGVVDLLDEIGAAQDARLATQLNAEAGAIQTLLRTDVPTCTCGWPDRDCAIRANGSNPAINKHLECGERDTAASSAPGVACAHTPAPEDA